jgi:hypothetical protein
MRDALEALASEVTRLLAQDLPGWTYQPGDDFGCPRAVHTDGRAIVFEEAAGRVYIRGVYPDNEVAGLGVYVAGQRPHITVAIDRGARAVMLEIRRRFLPGYEDYLGRFRKQLAALQAAAAGRLQVAERLAALVPGGYVRLPGRHSIEVSFYQPGRSHFAATVFDGNVTLSLQWIPPELAEQVLGMVGDWLRSNKHAGSPGEEESP